MLTCIFGWRTLIPIRGIPYLTGGTFDARDVATLFFNLDMFKGEQFYRRTRPFRIDANNSAAPVAPGEWGLLHSYFRGKGDGPLLELGDIRELPPRVFVWRRPFRTLYSVLSMHDGAKDALGVLLHAGTTFDWVEDFPLTPKQSAVVWEACGINPNRYKAATDPCIPCNEPALLQTDTPPIGQSNPTSRKKSGKDPELQAIAERLVANLREKRKRIPSLLNLAADIKKDAALNPKLAGVAPSSIARRIDATWKSRKG